MSETTRALVARVGLDPAKNVIQVHAVGLDARLIAASFVSPNRMEGKGRKNEELAGQLARRAPVRA